MLFFGTGTMPVHARKRVSGKGRPGKATHAGLLEKLDRDANAARLYESGEEMGYGDHGRFRLFHLAFSQRSSASLTDPGLS